VPGDLPLIDVGPLARDAGSTRATTATEVVATAIADACARYGFFRVVGHGVAAADRARLDRSARAFFALPRAAKERVAMHRAGRAWRGWFPLGGELTAGVADQKEGLYFGTELAPEHPAVVAGRPLHGPNLFPDDPADLRPAVLGWMAAMTDLGQRLLQAMALGLGLPPDWFRTTLTAEPTVLFRIFRYPPSARDGWGVAEHTDYGLLTLLAQDGRAGLEVHGPEGWIAVPADPEVIVVNLGDMLERLTAGRYRSTPHRVHNTGAGDRLSFPTFLDPSWDAVCPVLPRRHEAASGDPAGTRWDGADPRAWSGTYGEYLTNKVAKVFPHLRATIERPR
jgi:isopenicillin N synthase-like dioxygenase